MTKAIDLLKAAGVPCRLTSTIVKENAADLQKIYKFATNKKIPLQHTVSVLKSSRGSQKDIASSRFDFSDFSDEFTLESLERLKCPDTESPFAWCGSYKKSMWITWNGNVQMCSFVTQPSVKFSGDLKSDWFLLNEKCKGIKNPPECDKCDWKSFCQKCPGALCAESGDAEKISPDFCRTAEKLFNIYNAMKESETV